MVVLFRYPMFQEDEGRVMPMGTYGDLNQAEEAIEFICRDGYFNKKDFFTTEIPSAQTEA